MKHRIGLIAALAAAGLASTTALATAAPAPKLDVQVVGNVRIDPGDPTIGYVQGRYICEGGDGAHVWVSVKQAESRLPEQDLTLEGSGESAAAWSHSHANTVTCDGSWHVATLTVNQDEWGQGELEEGSAWVQFCVIPPGGTEDGPIAWSMRFAAVK